MKTRNCFCLPYAGGYNVVEESGQFLGWLGHSVGPSGESSGLFEHCRTTCPMQELGLIEIGQELPEGLDVWRWAYLPMRKVSMTVPMSSKSTNY